jgi:flavin reductase (DIM6/NTAB) family NADH-FMN oxidoreductase RutF
MWKNLQLNSNHWSKWPKHTRVNFLNALSGLRPLALIGTLNQDGSSNLAIFNSLFHLGAQPPLIGFIIRPDVSPRHTLENLRHQKYFTLNHVSQEIYTRAHQTSARYQEKESEFFHCQLTPEILAWNSSLPDESGNDNLHFPCPFVKESPLKMAMERQREIYIEENQTHMIIAKVLEVYMDSSQLNEDYLLTNDGHLPLDKLQLVCGSSLDSYYSPQFLSRLSYAKANEEVKTISRKGTLHA